MLLNVLLFSLLLFGEACKTLVHHDRIKSAILANVPEALKKDKVPIDTPKELKLITNVSIL
jgi:hypothetical protein